MGHSLTKGKLDILVLLLTQLGQISAVVTQSHPTSEISVKIPPDLMQESW